MNSLIHFLSANGYFYDHLIKLGLGSLVTIGLYSILYKENKFYRYCEHVYIGLAVGYTMVITWSDVLHDLWWSRMLGEAATATHPAKGGHWAWMLLLPVGLLGYTVFNRKYNWMSRIPIGMIIGFAAGQNIQLWFNQYGPQISNSIRPIFPTTSQFFQPDLSKLSPTQVEQVKSVVYGSQALTNLLFVLTIISVLTYFLFSFEVKSKTLKSVSLVGRWLLMVGFGAIFGSTVSMRFTLVIDRMYLVFVEFLQQGLYQGVIVKHFLHH